MPACSASDPDGFRQLLEQARRQSPEALGLLWLHCRGYLQAIARKKLDPALIGKVSPSDIVQETFLEAQRDFAGFHGECEGELRAWLTRILLNNLANVSRQFSGTQMRDLHREVPLPRPPDDSDAVGDLASDSSTASAKAMAREETAQLEQAIGQLPDDYRLVLRLRYQQNLTFEQIGGLMDRSADASRKLWARAVARLQEQLED